MRNWRIGERSRLRRTEFAAELVGVRAKKTGESLYADDVLAPERRLRNWRN